jgi:hypothetical protein
MYTTPAPDGRFEAVMTARVEEVKADNAPPGDKSEVADPLPSGKVEAVMTAPKAVDCDSGFAKLSPSVSGDGTPSGKSRFSYVYRVLRQDETQDDIVDRSEAEAVNKQVKAVVKDKPSKKDGVTASPLPRRRALTERTLTRITARLQRRSARTETTMIARLLWLRELSTEV